MSGVQPATKPQKFGINNLKKMVGFSLSFTQELSQALADGKFRWIEAFGFIDELLQIEGIVKAWPDIKAELNELNAVETAELNEFVTANFQVENIPVEDAVKNSLAFVVSAVALIEGFKKK